MAVADDLGVALPPISSDVRVGDLRALVGGLLTTNPSPERAFNIMPTLDVQELLTDNVFEQSSPRRADLVTTITPAVLVTGQSRLVQANISVSPNIELYASTSSQDQIVPQFNGSVLVTVVPDELFLQLRGSGLQQSSNGNYGNAYSPYYSTSSRTNVVSVEASPYATHRFGGYGTVQVGYVYNYSEVTAKNSLTNTQVSPVAAALAQQSELNNGLTNQTTGQGLLTGVTTGTTIDRSNEEYIQFTTGENFGRLNYSLRLDATQQSGSASSVLNGSHQSTVNNSFGYGINRNFALLASFGYEDIYYSGLPPTRINDATWSGGVRITPNENSTILVKYGHQEGENAVTASASYALTQRVRLLGEYSESLTSSLGEIQSDLQNSTVDQFGNNISTATGAPTLIADQLLSLQSSLYRLKRFTGSVISVYDRDVISLSVEQERRTVVAAASSSNAFSDHGASASVSWSHQLNPDITATAAVRYGVDTIDVTGGGGDQSFSFDVSTSYAFTSSFSGRAEYYIRNQTSNVAGQSYLQNAVVIGLHKSF